MNALYRGRERAIAFAVWGSTIGGMAAVVPLVGGWLTTNRSLDVLGVVLSASGLGAIVFALIERQTYGWWRQSSGALSPVPISLAAGLALMAAFVAAQSSRARAGRVVFVDLRILGIRSFRYGSTAALIVVLGEFGLIFTLPLLLQNALGYSAFGTGWLIFSLAVGTFLISAMTPHLTSQFGGRAVVRLGLAVEAVAAAGLALSLSADVKGWLIAAWLFAYGAGVGMATAQLTSVILAEVPVDESGRASDLQSTFRQLGSALGVAILGAVLLSTLGSATSTNLANAGIPAAQGSPIVDAVTGSAGAAIDSRRAALRSCSGRSGRARSTRGVMNSHG